MATSSQRTSPSRSQQIGTAASRFGGRISGVFRRAVTAAQQKASRVIGGGGGESDPATTENRGDGGNFSGSGSARGFHSSKSKTARSGAVEGVSSSSSSPSLSLATTVANIVDGELSVDAWGLPSLTTTDASVVSSQGLLVSRDGSASFSHCSTSPPNYYDCIYSVPEGMNMDRGGFGHASAGTNFGVVFDGVTAGGAINVYAAQAFAEYSLKWLAQFQDRLVEGQIEEVAANEIFSGCCAYTNNHGRRDPSMNSEGGSATGVVATFRRDGPQHALLLGANIGDAVAIVIRMSSGMAEQVTYVKRRDNRANDTGGQLTMCMGLNGAVWPFSARLEARDLLVLATDGLSDNIFTQQLDTIIPSIVRARIFDGVPVNVCDCVHGCDARLPGMADLLEIIGAGPSSMDALHTVAPEVAALRLTNYLQWVTRSIHAQEQDYYSTRKRLDRLHRASRRHGNGVGDGGGDAAAAAAAATAAQQMETRLSELTRLRKLGIAGKTDDCMVTVMRPFHTLGGAKRLR